MSSIIFVEDIFLEFATAVDFGQIRIQSQDSSAIHSFQTSLLSQKQLTKAQSQFILRLLQKYRVLANTAGVDVQPAIDNPLWKNTFRILDQSKKVYVEKNDLGNIDIFVKFPYNYKDIFEKEFPGSESVWDTIKNARRIKIKNINVIHLREFAIEHELELDTEFQNLCDEIEEIWIQEENISPHSKIINDRVEIVNANEDSIRYFENNKTGNVTKDLFLAKSMSFCLKTEEKNLSTVEKIASSTDNYFYSPRISKVLELYKNLDRPKIALIIDRTSDVEEYVKFFVEQADDSGIDRNDIKVCFRLSAEEDSNKKFNNWIKENNLTGPVADGKIFILSHKPPKWLFKETEDIKIIVTNHLFNSTSTVTSSWFNSHPCVIFVGDYTPAVKKISKGRSIVEL